MALMGHPKFGLSVYSEKETSIHSEQGGAVDHTSSVYGLCVIRTFGPPNYSTAPDCIEENIIITTNISIYIFIIIFQWDGLSGSPPNPLTTSPPSPLGRVVRQPP